jgi:hypothetical protein
MSEMKYFIRFEFSVKRSSPMATRPAGDEKKEQHDSSGDEDCY